MEINAAIEVGIGIGGHRGRDLHLVGDDVRQRGHLLQMVRRAFERDHLVAKLAVAGLLRDETGVGILPVELLDGKLRGGLSRLDGVALEDRVAGQRRLHFLVVDAVDGEAHAADGLLAVAPGDGDDVVVGEGDGVLHGVPLHKLPSFRPSPRSGREPESIHFQSHWIPAWPFLETSPFGLVWPFLETSPFGLVFAGMTARKMSRTSDSPY